MPSRALWSSHIAPNSQYIEGLEEMVYFHNIKPYHIVIMEYRYGGNFKVEIFNPFCGEIDYCVDHNNVRLNNSQSLELNTDNVLFSNLESTKLFECYRHNAYHNFVGLHNLRIEADHLEEGSQK